MNTTHEELLSEIRILRDEVASLSKSKMAGFVTRLLN